MTQRDVQQLILRLEQLEARLEKLEHLERLSSNDRGELLQRLARIEAQISTTMAFLRYGLPVAIATLGLIISVLTYLLEKALT